MQSKDGGHVALHVWERRNTQIKLIPKISYIQSLQGNLKAPCFIRLRGELILYMVRAPIYGLFVRTKI
jgi:hypothetical protein